MSQAALAQAVTTYLRTALMLDANSCEFGLDGQPPPACGETFVRVWPGRWAGIDCEGLGETFGVNVTVTRRVSFAPTDRVGTEAWLKVITGLEATLRTILVKMHLDVGGDAILNAANTILGASVNGFVEPLRFRDGGFPEPKGPDWFNAVNPEGGRWANAGLVQTLVFDGATRYQTIASMT